MPTFTHKQPRNVILSLVVGAFAASGGEPAALVRKPNILFIFTDDHSPNAIGAYGRWLKSVNPTPTIDRLAAQGMTFHRSYCTNSICGPVRAVIETGKHSHLNGFRQNGNKFDWNQQTFPKLLQQSGYQTILYGKYHLDGIPKGYDDWAVLPDQGLYYNPDFLTEKGQTTAEGYCTDIVTDMAVEWLKTKRDPSRPFMLRVQHKAPHRNWMPALRHLTAYDDALGEDIRVTVVATGLSRQAQRPKLVVTQTQPDMGLRTGTHDVPFNIPTLNSPLGMGQVNSPMATSNVERGQTDYGSMATPSVWRTNRTQAAAASSPMAVKRQWP